MSRSRRHEPVIGNCSAPSEKLAKRWWNRTFRRRTRDGVRRGDEALPVSMHRETEVWSGPKDGKHRFSASEHPALMRK